MEQVLHGRTSVHLVYMRSINSRLDSLGITSLTFLSGKHSMRRKLVIADPSQIKELVFFSMDLAKSKGL